jgi:hypothetical protein
LTVAYPVRSAVSVRVSLIPNTRTLHRRLERPLPFTWTKTPDGLLDTQTAAGAGRRDGLDDDATLVTMASPGRAARDVPSQASVA